MTYDAIVRRLIPDVEYHQNRYVREISRRVHGGCRWLDLGAGAALHGGWVGESPPQLAGRAAVLVGCDLVVEHMRANAELTARVVALGEGLPFEGAQFDLVTANMVLEHLTRPDEVFAQVARVLKPGGRFVFVTPNRWHPAVWILDRIVPVRWRSAMARAQDARESEHVFPTHYRANTVSALRGLAARAGLGIEVLEAFRSFPMTRRPLVATFVECLWIRAQRYWPLSVSASNLVGCLIKPGAG